MLNKPIIFVGGLHRSGTSLVHQILRSHPEISGFTNTGVPEDEGQHLQTVYLPAKAFGGTGSFGFNASSFMDETNALATKANAAKLYQQWSKHWDMRRPYLVEKSPPNLVRTRFLQKMFPRSLFVIILRHPIAVSYATRKCSGRSIPSLLEHFFRCYERFRDDKLHLSKVCVLRYEEFVSAPDRTLRALLHWIGLDFVRTDISVRPNVNREYFRQWEIDRRSLIKNMLYGFRGRHMQHEARANAFGYSMNDTEALLPMSWSDACTGAA